MRLTKIEVEKLFGLFSHKIQLRSRERMTIIHGPNGYGKTAMLRLTNALLTGRLSDLRTIEYKTFTIHLDNGDEIKVERTVHKPTGERSETIRKSTLKITSKLHPNEPLITGPTTPKDAIRPLDFPLSYIEERFPELQRVESDLWKNRVTQEYLTIAEVIEEYSEVFSQAKWANLNRQPDWYKAVKSGIDVKFIQTQRLLMQGPNERDRNYPRNRPYGNELPTYRPAVEVFSEELVGNITGLLRDYAALSQSLDSTFPTRLVKASTSSLTVSNIRIRLQQLATKRERLMQAGMLDKQSSLQLEEQSVTPKNRGVLSIYVQDVEKKLGVFDDLVQRIEVLQSIINSRFAFKQLVVTKDRGFQFSNSFDIPLSAQALSSGEQHELVLAYELLFKTKPNSLILIDEPEISLHVAWQRNFLTDLQKMAELSRFDSIIATHSPQIIDERWDLTEELGADDLKLSADKKTQAKRRKVAAELKKTRSLKLKAKGL